MKVTPAKLNSYLLFKLPSAYICGVRATYLDKEKCIASVKFRWINQNPFNSMFWAVQGMAAELSTGALVMSKIMSCGHKVSMLVANNNGSFSKKALGRITFECKNGGLVDVVLRKAIETGEGQTVWMNSIGRNSDGVEVSNFNFQWTLKIKSK